MTPSAGVGTHLRRLASVPLQGGGAVRFPEPAVVVQAAALLAASYLLARTTSAALSALSKRFVSQRFRVALLVPVVKFLIYGTGLYVAASLLFELSTAQLVAFSGLLGAALGLGLQDLLADIFGGLVLVGEHPYRIGDKVSVGEHYGEVVGIGIRSTTMRTPTDTLVTVPNYRLLDSAIANANAGDREMRVAVEFFVDAGADVRTVRRIVEDAMATSRYVYVADDMPIETVVEDDLNYWTVRGKAYVGDLRNEYPFKTDVTERVLAEFDERNIESPAVAAGGAERE